MSRQKKNRKGAPIRNGTSIHQIREQNFPENHHPAGIIKNLPQG